MRQRKARYPVLRFLESHEKRIGIHVHVKHQKIDDGQYDKREYKYPAFYIYRLFPFILNFSREDSVFIFLL